MIALASLYLASLSHLADGTRVGLAITAISLAMVVWNSSLCDAK